MNKIGKVPKFGLRWPGPGHGPGQGQARPMAQTVAQAITNCGP